MIVPTKFSKNYKEKLLVIWLNDMRVCSQLIVSIFDVIGLLERSSSFGQGCIELYPFNKNVVRLLNENRKWHCILFFKHHLSRDHWNKKFLEKKQKLTSYKVIKALLFLFLLAIKTEQCVRQQYFYYLNRRILLKPVRIRLLQLRTFSREDQYCECY